MTKKPTQNDRFIEFLEAHREDRAMLAALRRGLDRPPGSVPEVTKYLRRWVEDLPDYLKESYEDAYYLIAPLFALHPLPGGQKNMGAHLADLSEPGQEPPPSVERRFMLLASAHPDDLADYLRQAVKLCKNKQVPVNWQQLLKDIIAWKSNNEDRQIKVQKQWGREFWRPRTKTQVNNQNQPNLNEEGE